VETIPEGSQPLSTVAAGYLVGFERLRRASRHDPGPIEGRWRTRNTAPAERSASDAGWPWASTTSSKLSPIEWATMNQGGIPLAHRAPIIEPADVPTT
jgi:hypothetical protein